MKTTTIIIAAIFTLQVSNIFAGNSEMNNSSNSDFSSSAVLTLAPTTPVEADFSDLVPEPVFDQSTLAPVTPAFANFDDNAPEVVSNSINLAPETPSFADFDEETNTQVTAFSLLPVTPAEADFE